MPHTAWLCVALPGSEIQSKVFEALLPERSSTHSTDSRGHPGTAIREWGPAQGTLPERRPSKERFDPRCRDVKQREVEGGGRCAHALRLNGARNGKGCPKGSMTSNVLTPSLGRLSLRRSGYWR